MHVQVLKMHQNLCIPECIEFKQTVRASCLTLGTLAAKRKYLKSMKNGKKTKTKTKSLTAQIVDFVMSRMLLVKKSRDFLRAENQ